MANLTGKTGRTGTVSFTFDYSGVVRYRGKSGFFTANILVDDGYLFTLEFAGEPYVSGMPTQHFWFKINDVTIEERFMVASDSDWNNTGSVTCTFTTEEWAEFRDIGPPFWAGDSVEWYDKLVTITPTMGASGFASIGSKLVNQQPFAIDGATATNPLKFNAPYVRMAALASNIQGSASSSITCTVTGYAAPDGETFSGSYTQPGTTKSVTYSASILSCSASSTSNEVGRAAAAYTEWSPIARVQVDGDFYGYDEAYHAPSAFFLDNYLEAHRYTEPVTLKEDNFYTYFEVAQSPQGNYIKRTRESCLGSYSKSFSWEKWMVYATGGPFIFANHNGQSVTIPFGKWKYTANGYFGIDSARLIAGPVYSVWGLKRVATYPVETGSGAANWSGAAESGHPVPTITDGVTYVRFTADATYDGFAQLATGAALPSAGGIFAGAWRYLTLVYRSHGAATQTFQLWLSGQTDSGPIAHHALEWDIVTGADDEWQTTVIDLKHPDRISKIDNVTTLARTAIETEGEHKSDFDFSFAQETEYQYGFNDLFGPVNWWNTYFEFRVHAGQVIDIQSATLTSGTSQARHSLAGNNLRQVGIFADEKLVYAAGLTTTLDALKTAILSDYSVALTPITPAGGTLWNLDGPSSWLGGGSGFYYDGSWRSFLDVEDAHAAVTHKALATAAICIGIRPSMRGPSEAESDSGTLTTFRFRTVLCPRLYGHAWAHDRPLRGHPVRVFYPGQDYQHPQGYPDHPALATTTDANGYWTVKDRPLLKTDLNGVMRVQASSGYIVEVFDKNGVSFSTKAQDFTTRLDTPQHFSFWIPAPTGAESIDYAVSDHMRHVRTFTRDGTVWVGYASNHDAKQWTDQDTGIAGTYPCIAAIQGTNTFTLAYETGSGIEAKTGGIGLTWSREQMLVVSGAKWPRLVNTRHRAQFLYYYKAGAIYGVTNDQRGFSSPFTVVSDSDDAQFAAAESRGINGEWRVNLIYQKSGDLVQISSTNGRDFS